MCTSIPVCVTTYSCPRHLGAHHLEYLRCFLLWCVCVVFLLRKFWIATKGSQNDFQISFERSLSLVVRMLQLLVFAVCLSALTGLGAPFMDKKAMEDMQERMKRLREVPGFDPEEYKRYWEEMMKNDPSKP